jgi:LPS-assembly lipoprotein
MSSPRPASKARHITKIVAVSLTAALSASALGGCGFHPLYGPTASGADLSDVMKTITISPINTRVGQKLRNELIFKTTGGGEAEAPQYRLDIVLRESVRNTLVTRAGDPTGQILDLYAEFRLVRLKDQQVVFKGESTQTAAYDLAGSTGNAGSVYGDVRAQIDAENRAARSLADTLKTRLAAYLSRAA